MKMNLAGLFRPTGIIDRGPYALIGILGFALKHNLDRMLAGSELCTGAALDGIPQDVSDEEVAAHPDPASCAVLPWKKDVAWFASDLWCQGKPFDACSRNILKRALAKADALGYGLNLGMEARVLRAPGRSRSWFQADLGPKAP